MQYFISVSCTKKRYIKINDSGYNESNDQVDTISDSKKQVDPSSDPRIDTHITNGIQKLSIRAITFKPVLIRQDLVMSVQETFCDGLLGESLKLLHMISVNEVFTDTACNSAQIDRIVWTHNRAIHRTPAFNVEFFSPSRISNTSFAKWPSNTELLNTSIDGYAALERNLNCFCIGKMGVKSLPDEIVTDLDPSKRLNLAISVLSKSQKFIYFGLLSFNRTD